MSESSFAAAVLADEQLLSALAAGEDVAAGGLGELLSAWHAELAAATPASAALPALPRIAGRRIPRRTIAAAAALCLMTGGGVAAAAASGPRGPFAALHRVLFGGAAAERAADVAEIRALLDRAAKRIAAAQTAGFIAPDIRAAVTELLDRAANELEPDVAGADALRARIAALRVTLAAVPGAPTASTALRSAQSVPHSAGPKPGGQLSGQVSGKRRRGESPAPVEPGRDDPSGGPGTPGSGAGEPGGSAGERGGDAGESDGGRPGTARGAGGGSDKGSGSGTDGGSPNRSGAGQDDGSGGDGSGDDGSGDDGSGDDGSGDEGSGRSGSGHEGSGDEGSGGSGDDSSGHGSGNR